MKKILLSALGVSLFASILLAHSNTVKDDDDMMGNNEKTPKTHMGDHMHNGKMMNHSNPNGMTDDEMHQMKNDDKDEMQEHMEDEMGKHMDEMHEEMNDHMKSNDMHEDMEKEMDEHMEDGKMMKDDYEDKMPNNHKMGN